MKMCKKKQLGKRPVHAKIPVKIGNLYECLYGPWTTGNVYIAIQFFDTGSSDAQARLINLETGIRFNDDDVSGGLPRIDWEDVTDKYCLMCCDDKE